MCDFFSFCGDGYGNYIYSDWEHRKEDLKQNWDSHTKIMTDQGIPNVMQDRWSKYEYNPLTKKFCVDGGIEGHDHAAAEYWVNQLDFSGVVKPLVIKPVRNPLTGRPKEITEKEINLLRKWGSVWDSVGDSVGDSVWAYISSFFDIPCAYDFSSCVQLWEAGFLPVYDGQRWILLSGKKTRIVYKIKT